MALDASVERTDVLGIHWAWGEEHRNLAHMETPTFRSLDWDLDSILDVKVINTLQMGSRGPKKWRQKMYRNFKADFSENTAIYFRAHQKIAETLRLGGPLAHRLAPTWSNLTAGSSCSRCCPNWLRKCLWAACSSANHTYGREFSLTSNRGFFCCNLWLLPPCALSLHSLGEEDCNEIALCHHYPFLSNLNKPSSLSFFSSIICLGPLTALLDRHQFVISFWHWGVETGPAVPDVAAVPLTCWLPLWCCNPVRD